MPQFESVICVSRLAAEVFDFFCRPANMIEVTPPELNMRLLEAPERLQLGSRVTVVGRRWGVAQRIVSEVTVFEPSARIVDEQREGPFRMWTHAHRFEELPTGTRITDRIDFKPPGGMLGLVVTAKVIGRELEAIFAYRTKRLQELLGTN